MKTMEKIIAVGLVILLALIAGCGAGRSETPTPELDVGFVPVVSVTGEVVPAAWTTVSAQTGGTVIEVPVEPGDEVAAGDLLIQLDPTDGELVTRRAETMVQAAQAELAFLQAAPQAEEIAVAAAKVEAAQAAIARATAQGDQLKAGVSAAEIAAAEARVTAAQADQLVAWETHEQTMECFTFDLPDGGEKKVCPLLGPVEEQTRHSLQVANEQLDAARIQLDALSAGADDRLRAAEAAVCAATAQRDAAQAELDLLRAGATAEEIAAKKADLVQAQAALDATLVGLERTQVRAPVGGTVATVDARTGELVLSGQPLVTVGDLSTLRVETTDLDEIDVAQVEIDQDVSITFDAVPEQVFTGHVTRISPMAEPGTGGVNYTVIIELDEIAPQILWGMTAFVDIEVGQ